jgi:hypothetical protein
MKKSSLKWWEDPKRSKPGKCAVCKKCVLTLDGRHCMYGGPFIGYEKVEDEQEETTRGNEGTT